MVGYKKKGKAVTESGPKKAAKKEPVSKNKATEEKDTVVPSNSEPADNVDEHPLQIGHYLVVKYRDGSNRLAKIIESAVAPNPKATQYYIHYSDFNRRMDEWIAAQRIVSYPSEANVLGAAREAQENAAKKLKSIDSKGNLVDKPAGDNAVSPPASSPRSLLGSGNQRSGQKSRSNSIVGAALGVGPENGVVISTVADMDHDEHEGEGVGQASELM